MADGWTSHKNRVVYRVCGNITGSKLNYDREIIYAPDDLWLNYWRLIFLVLKGFSLTKCEVILFWHNCFYFYCKYISVPDIGYLSSWSLIVDISISPDLNHIDRSLVHVGLWLNPGASHILGLFSRFCWHWGNRENMEYHLISFKY